jgi:hypothetical protein
VIVTADPRARRMAAVLCAVAIGWAVLLPLAPLLHGSRMPRFVRVLAWAPYVAGSLVCHQRADRSFTIRSVTWPVCGRCAGLYLSAAVGAVLSLAFGRTRLRSGGRVPSVRSLADWRLALTASALPTFASWSLERAGWWSPASSTRAWLAVPLGAVIGALLASLARQPGPAGPGT